MPGPECVVFLNGVYGVGKSAVLDHLGDLLAAAGRPFSLFDVDWFHRSWPPAEDDAGNVRIEAANMSAAWRNYLTVGDRQPIVAGVLRTAEDTARYAGVFELPVRSVLLTAAPSVVRSRLSGRYGSGRPSALAWHMDRHEAAASLIEAGGQYETTIETDALPPARVAALVAAHFALVE